MHMKDLVYVTGNHGQLIVQRRDHVGSVNMCFLGINDNDNHLLSTSLGLQQYNDNNKPQQ
jgi:hypothetical protein